MGDAAELHIRRGNDNWPRQIRLYRFLRDKGPSHRDAIMHWSGFPSPKEHPVCAYVEFINAVDRLDRCLRRAGQPGIAGGSHTNEVYSLEVPA